MSDAQEHQEFRPGRTRRHRPRHWLAIGLGLAIVCGSGTALAALPATTPPSTEPAPESTTEPSGTEPIPESTAAPTTTATTVAPTPVPVPTPPPAPAPVDVDLVAQCTSSEDIDAGTRTFRLANHGTEAVAVTLRNVASGGSVSGTAAPGSSTWEVPASDGSNTTEVVANGQVVATSDSTNLLCGALHGHAECNPSNGTTTITWTVSNNDGSPTIVLSDSRGVDFQPNPDAPHGEATGVEIVEGPANDDEITETVTVQLSDGETSELSASVTAAACTGPSLAPDVSFTFTKTPSVLTAGVGGAVEYVYCGQNTGVLPLEVVRLVDDRLGVVIELQGVETVVAPGDSLCNTDIGEPVTYTVRLADLGTTITNHAVVTVRTQEATPRVFQATSTADVDVPLPPAVLALLSGDEDKTWVCHRTLSATNPYNLNNVSGSSTDASGHTNHDEDIIPPGPWGPGQNYDPANTAIWINDCQNVKALPLAPTLVQANCQGGVVVPPRVQVADKPLGVTYSVAPSPLGDGSADVRVTVTAKLTIGFDWGTPLTAGWTPVDASTATWTGTLRGTSCAAAKPVVPTPLQASCIAGELRPPSLALPETTNITYSVTPTSGYAPGTQVTVTATLAEGAAWATDIAPWTRTSPTTATYQVTFAKVACIAVAPVEPTVVPATCTGGVVTPPVVTTGSTDGLIYAVIPNDLGDGTTDIVVNVTASVLDGYAFTTPLPTGWTPVAETRMVTFEVTLGAAPCRPVTPQDPELRQAVCANGVVSRPTLTLPTTTNIEYSVTPGEPYQTGQTVTVTASLTGDDVRWPSTMPSGWDRVNATTATSEITFDDVACTPVSPVVPEVRQATCTGGVVVPPTVSLPITRGIVYSVDPQDLGDGTTTLTVTVTAELGDGDAWGQFVGGWSGTGPTTAVLTLELPGASCTAITPVAPTVTQAVCAAGVLSVPTLVPADTDDVTYTVEPGGPYGAGQSVTVTATLTGAVVAWPSTLPTGWVRVDAVTATFGVTFASVACTPVSPVAPAVVQATCTDGVVVPPTVSLPMTAGITSSMEPATLGDGTTPVTVTVTAKLADGFEWGQLGDDWTRVDATTTTLTLDLPGASCTAVTPAAPTVTQAVCAAGELSAPLLEFATTDKVTYTVDPQGPYAVGQPVIVTATLAASGVGWGDGLPDGWVESNPTTATLEITFDDVACTPISPGAPVVEQATCTGGVVVPPTVSLPATAGIVYTVDPQDLGDGTTTRTVTVTAALGDGSEWGQLGGGWSETGPTTATLTLELPGASCTAITPAAPAVTQAVCSEGGLSAPSLGSASTDEVTYTVDPQGPYVAGQSVIVTAVLDPAGVAWGDDLPNGWTAVDDRTATFAVTFDDEVCVAVSPVIPDVLPPDPSGEVVVELPVTPGVVYTAIPGTSETPPVVIAVVQPGYEWGPLPDQWTQVDADTATFAPPPAAPTTTPGALAHTGGATLLLQSLLAAGLLMMGCGLCGLGRRRAVA